MVWEDFQVGQETGKGFGIIYGMKNALLSKSGIGLCGDIKK
ncbi:MAG: hypothetical protein Q8R38_07825 [Candidatus Omnitrophota bacterium]|nr:hypothetical protein [Candidatus Omnitrophota bacterium]